MTLKEEENAPGHYGLEVVYRRATEGVRRYSSAFGREVRQRGIIMVERTWRGEQIYSHSPCGATRYTRKA